MQELMDLMYQIHHMQIVKFVNGEPPIGDKQKMGLTLI